MCILHTVHRFPYGPAVTVACAYGCVRRGVHRAECGGESGCECVCHTYPGQVCDQWNGPDGCGPHASDPACRGCAPRPSVPGGLVCVACWERTTEALMELPELYRDLLAPTRAPGGARVSGGETEAPLVLGDAPRLSREWLKGVLLHWALVLSAPIAPATIPGVPRQRTGEPTPHGRALSRPVSDNPEVTAAVVLRHAEWLLAQPEYADQLVHDVEAVHRDARRTAYPSGPTGLLLGTCPRTVARPTPEDPQAVGPCGAPVRAYERRDLIACPGCGTVADPLQWRAWMVTPPGEDADALADAYALATWLSLEHCRVITPDVIRTWVRRGTRVGVLARPVDTAGAPLLTRERGRILYSVAVTRDYARRLYGAPVGWAD